MLKKFLVTCSALLLCGATVVQAQGLKESAVKTSERQSSQTQTPVEVSKEDAVLARFKAQFGQSIPVSSVRQMPYGLYELMVGRTPYYTDENVQFVMDGHLIDAKTQVDLTQARLDELARIDFKALPFDLALKQVKGNGSRQLAIFEDPNCGYCKQMRRAMEGLTDVTIYTFMFPILSQDSVQKVRDVWCAKDPVKAWDDWMIRGRVPTKSTCNAPIEQLRAVGERLQVQGTPAVFFEDGMRVPGAMSAEQLDSRLNQVAKRGS